MWTLFCCVTTAASPQACPVLCPKSWVPSALPTCFLLRSLSMTLYTSSFNDHNYWPVISHPGNHLFISYNQNDKSNPNLYPPPSHSLNTSHEEIVWGTAVNNIFILFAQRKSCVCSSSWAVIFGGFAEATVLLPVSAQSGSAFLCSSTTATSQSDAQLRLTFTERPEGQVLCCAHMLPSVHPYETKECLNLHCGTSVGETLICRWTHKLWYIDPVACTPRL